MYCCRFLEPFRYLYYYFEPIDFDNETLSVMETCYCYNKSLAGFLTVKFQPAVQHCQADRLGDLIHNLHSLDQLGY